MILLSSSSYWLKHLSYADWNFKSKIFSSWFCHDFSNILFFYLYAIKQLIFQLSSRLSLFFLIMIPSGNINISLAINHLLMELSKHWINIISSTPPWSQAPPPLPLGGSAQDASDNWLFGFMEVGLKPPSSHTQREKKLAPQKLGLMACFIYSVFYLFINHMDKSDISYSHGWHASY